MTTIRVTQTYTMVLRSVANVSSAAFANLGYETAGSSAGLAASWEYQTLAAAEQFAGFDTVSEAVEDFEEDWSSNQSFLFALAGVAAASFDAASGLPPQAFEDFEEGWLTSPFVTTLTGASASFDTGTPQNFEDFEQQWSDNQNYLFALSGTAAASFDTGTPEAFEDFEEQWASNENYLFALSGTSAALFDAGANAFENFEGTWTPMP